MGIFTQSVAELSSPCLSILSTGLIQILYWYQGTLHPQQSFWLIKLITLSEKEIRLIWHDLFLTKQCWLLSACRHGVWQHVLFKLPGWAYITYSGFKDQAPIDLNGIQKLPRGNMTGWSSAKPVSITIYKF